MKQGIIFIIVLLSAAMLSMLSCAPKEVTKTCDTPDCPNLDDTPPPCTDGIVVCNGNKIEKCIADSWVLQQDCSTEQSECIDPDFEGEADPVCEPLNDGCPDDRWQCDGDVIQYCEDGVWGDKEDCTATSKICYEPEDDASPDAVDVADPYCTEESTSCTLDDKRCVDTVVELCKYNDATSMNEWFFDEDCYDLYLTCGGTAPDVSCQ